MKRERKARDAKLWGYREERDFIRGMKSGFSRPVAE